MIIDENSITNKYINLYSLSTSKVVLPVFQRGFAWKKEQTEKLLQDIEDLLDSNDYATKQIYLLDFIGFEEFGVFKLADGQQRLVSISILIRCLLEISEKNDLAAKIHNFELSYDDLDFQKQWQSFCNGKMSGALKNVYLHMRAFVEKHIDDLDDISIILMNNVYIYLKMACNADDAFDIFEQINAGGKPLTKDEIINTVIKQYSGKYSIDLGISKKELKELLVSYYKYTIANKQVTFNNFAIMSFLDQYVIKDKAAFEKFKKYIDTTKTVADSPEWFIAKLLGRTQLIDMVYAYEVNGTPLKNNKASLKTVMMPVFLLSAICSLSGANPGGRVKTFFDTVLEKIKDKVSDSDIEKYILEYVDINKDLFCVDMQTFAQLLHGKTKQKVMEALLLMDIMLRNTSGSFTPELINLEHIYPQNPDVEWSRNGWPINSDDQDVYIHSIGNYLILNEHINKKIQNNYIDVKQVEYDKIFADDVVLNTKMNSIDYGEFAIKQTQYIDERRMVIAQMIKDTFPLGKVFIQ